MAEKLWGHASAGMFGYSHLTGGFAGGQAEYVRVPFADVGPIKIESDLPDEKVLFLSDIFPTAYMGAEMCDIKPGDVVAVWGAGPVGLLAMASAYLLGAEQVIAIDRVRRTGWRWRASRPAPRRSTTRRSTSGRRCRSSPPAAGRTPASTPSGMEAHSDIAPLQLYDRVKQAARLETDRGPALRQAILACRNGGTVSVIGVYGGLMDKFPMGSWMNRSITLQDRAVPRAALHPAAAGADRARRDRPQLRDHPPDAAGPGPGGVRDLQAQAGRLREGRPHALTRPPVPTGSPLAGRDDDVSVPPADPNDHTRPKEMIMTDPTTTQDVVDLLTTDHHEVLDLLEEIKTSTVPDRRRELADVVIGELVRHSVAEEMFVYPAMRRHLPDGDAAVEHDVGEHKQLEKLMKEWEVTEAGDADFDRVLRELEEVLRDHVQDEESEQFPQLRTHIPHDELVGMAERVEAAKKVAPTRPHPLAPNNALFHFVVGPGVGLVDRLRDAWTDRPDRD